jgi:hypothetical protein
MRNWQNILRVALERNRWSLDEVMQPEHWWAADIWAISSIREHHGLRLYVTFIVDPAHLRPHERTAVVEIAFTQEPLSDWHAEGAIVTLRPRDRNYPTQIDAAMIRIDEYRKQIARGAEPGAPPNGGPAEPLGNSGVGGGPPSVS